MRSLAALPKANLHLHLTGAMRPGTLAELAARHGLPIPAPLPADVQHGWETFQERYDAARCAVRTREDVMRVVREAIADNAADGGGGRGDAGRRRRLDRHVSCGPLTASIRVPTTPRTALEDP